MRSTIPEYLDLLLDFKPLFRKIEPGEVLELCTCLGARLERHPKGHYIVLAGEPLRGFALILEGEVAIQEDDYFGRRHIVSKMEAGELFGEAFVFAGLKRAPLSVMASEDSVLLFIDGRRLLEPCPAKKSGQLLQNLLVMVARKNVGLTEKHRVTSRANTKEKLLAYLLHTARQEGSTRFTIPYNRQELADYLGVERSAMSARLSELKREGKIDFTKNRFELLGGRDGAEG